MTSPIQISSHRNESDTAIAIKILWGLLRLTAIYGEKGGQHLSFGVSVLALEISTTLSWWDKI